MNTTRGTKSMAWVQSPTEYIKVPQLLHGTRNLSLTRLTFTECRCNQPPTTKSVTNHRRQLPWHASCPMCRSNLSTSQLSSVEVNFTTMYIWKWKGRICGAAYVPAPSKLIPRSAVKAHESSEPGDFSHHHLLLLGGMCPTSVVVPTNTMLFIVS
jgi:hypothetical protein